MQRSTKSPRVSDASRTAPNTLSGQIVLVLQGGGAGRTARTSVIGVHGAVPLPTGMGRPVPAHLLPCCINVGIDRLTRGTYA